MPITIGTKKVTPASAAPAPAKLYVPPKVLLLPEEKSAPMDQMEQFSFFIYGMPGIGKTTVCAQFPESLFFLFEPGADSLSVYKVEPQNWKEVISYVEQLEKQKAAGILRFKNFVFDTMDLAWDLVEEYVCTENGVDFLKDIGFGNGYKKAGQQLRDVLTRLKRLGGVILLSHQKDTKMEKITGGMNTYDYTHPSCSNTAAEVVRKWVAVCANYYIDESSKRWLRITPTKDCEAKCRLTSNFRYTDGSPMTDIPMGETSKESFANLRKAFNNEYIRTAKSK